MGRVNHYYFIPHELSIVPKEIIDQAKKIRIAGGYILVSSYGQKYGMISGGPQPNPGYTLRIEDISDGDEGPIITVRIVPPSPKSIQLQVISYPFIIGQISPDTKKITILGIKQTPGLEYI